jgi:hypothetical protein
MSLFKIIALEKEIDDDTESILSSSDTLKDFQKFTVTYGDLLPITHGTSGLSKVEIYIYRYPSDRCKTEYFQYNDVEINRQFNLLKQHLDHLADHFHYFTKYPKLNFFLKSNVNSRNRGEYHPCRKHFSSKAVILNNTFYNLELPSTKMSPDLLRVLIHELGHKESIESKFQKAFIQLINIRAELIRNPKKVSDLTLSKMITNFLEHFARFEELAWGFTYVAQVPKQQKLRLQIVINKLNQITQYNKKDIKALKIMREIWHNIQRSYSFRK